MTYRTILVEVDQSEAGKARASVAIGLATRFGASVTAVFLKPELIPPFIFDTGYVVTPGEVIQQFLDDRAKEITKVSLEARAVFEAMARDANCSFDWLEINGDSENELITCARRHDLSILPPTMKPVYGQASLTAARVGMASGAPVLVTPYTSASPPIGRRVLVAWKDAREPARVLNDAWPFLAGAEEVTFLTVSKSADQAMDQLLRKQVRAHGLKIDRFVVDRDESAATGDVIRRHAAQMGADLIVLGLFGHPRVQEFVLGGVSRNLLQAPPVPMLVSH